MCAKITILGFFPQLFFYSTFSSSVNGILFRKIVGTIVAGVEPAKWNSFCVILQNLTENRNFCNFFSTLKIVQIKKFFRLPSVKCNSKQEIIRWFSRFFAFLGSFLQKIEKIDFFAQNFFRFCFCTKLPTTPLRYLLDTCAVRFSC